MKNIMEERERNIVLFPPGIVISISSESASDVIAR